MFSNISDCRDTNPLCYVNKVEGRCNIPKLRWIMEKECKRTCNFCEGSVTAAPPISQCYDFRSAVFCQNKKEEGKCDSQMKYYREYMENNCRKTCNFCSTPTKIPTTLTSVPDVTTKKITTTVKPITSVATTQKPATTRKLTTAVKITERPVTTRTTTTVAASTTEEPATTRKLTTQAKSTERSTTTRKQRKFYYHFNI